MRSRPGAVTIRHLRGRRNRLRQVYGTKFDFAHRVHVRRLDKGDEVQSLFSPPFTISQQATSLRMIKLPTAVISSEKGSTRLPSGREMRMVWSCTSLTTRITLNTYRRKWSPGITSYYMRDNDPVRTLNSQGRRSFLLLVCSSRD